VAARQAAEAAAEAAGEASSIQRARLEVRVADLEREKGAVGRALAAQREEAAAGKQQQQAEVQAVGEKLEGAKRAREAGAAAHRTELLLLHQEHETAVLQTEQARAETQAAKGRLRTVLDALRRQREGGQQQTQELIVAHSSEQMKVAQLRLSV
jgi:hypothetical protein